MSLPNSADLRQKPLTTPKSIFYWLWWSLPLVLTYGLYRSTLFFPLNTDDISDYYWTRGTFTQIWLSQIGYHYYRPLLYTYYKLVFDLLTPYYLPLCYLLATTLHGLNGILVGKLTSLFSHQLAQRSPSPRSASWPIGLIAALLFVMNPFAVYAVPPLYTVHYVAVTTLTLVGLYAAIRFTRRPRQQHWWGTAMLASVLAPYLLESGVAVGAIVALGAAAYNGRATWRRRWRWGAVVLASATFLPLWLVLTKRSGSFALPGREALSGALPFFFQGITFAIQPVASWLHYRLGWDGPLAVWVVGVPTLAALILLLARLQAWRLLACALGWAALTSILFIISLPNSYILTAPRLLYLVAPAAAWLWAVGIWSFAALAHTPHLRGTLVLGSLCLAVSLPIYFVQSKLSLYIVGMDEVKQLLAIARRDPAERQLIVNPVSWISSTDQLYQVGEYNIVFVPNYVRPDQLVEANLHFHPSLDHGNMPAVREVADGLLYGVSSDQEPPLDWAGIGDAVLRYDRIWLTTLSSQSIILEDVGSVKSGATAIPATYLASFEGQVFLSSTQYQIENKAMVLTLDWKYLGPDPNATVFRHVFDCAGNVLGLGDGYALGRMLPFGSLKPGAVVHDIRQIPLDTLSANGCYYVEIGLFRPDGSRVTARAPNGADYENAVVSIEVNR